MLHILYHNKKFNQSHKIATFEICKNKLGNSLVFQWLGLHAFTAQGLGSIPGQGTKIPKAPWGCHLNKHTNSRIYIVFSIETFIPTQNENPTTSSCLISLITKIRM